MLNGDEDGKKDAIPSTPTRAGQEIKKQDDLVHYTFEDYPTSRNRAETVTPYGMRKNKFVVQQAGCDLPALDGKQNDHGGEDMKDDIIIRVRPRKKCSLRIHGSKPEPGCRFMYDRTEDRVQHLV